MADELSAYERKRQENMASNKKKLIALGLEEAAAAVRTKTEAKKRPREKKAEAAPRKPVRGSRRLAGEAVELLVEDDLSAPLNEGEAANLLDRPAGARKQASKAPRLTKEQSARLDALEEESAGPLTEEELEAVKEAIDYLQQERTASGWKGHKSKGTSLYAEKRQLLKEAAEMFGLRWPTWLGEIQGALPPMGTTETARDQTMFAIERAACGMGLDYKHWPDGVGVLLADREVGEGEAPAPRVLTLGSDTELLRREGQTLEAAYGHDAGNGWAYNHAVGKLRLYQEKLLGNNTPCAKSVRDLETALEQGHAPSDDDEAATARLRALQEVLAL